MELYLLLAEEKYEEAWDKASKRKDFEGMDVSFVCAHHLFPEKKEGIGEKIFRRCSEDVFFRKLKHSYWRMVRNLDTINKKREISFYLPGREGDKTWRPEDKLLLPDIYQYVINLARLLADKHRVTVYSNLNLDRSIYRLSPSNPQYKPEKDYFTDSMCSVCISWGEKAQDNASKVFVIPREGVGLTQQAHSLVWMSEKVRERMLRIEPCLSNIPSIILPPVGPKLKERKKRNPNSIVYASLGHKDLGTHLEDYRRLKDKLPLSLDVFSLWKKDEVDKFRRENPDVEVGDFLKVEESLGRYSFFLVTEGEELLGHLAQAHGCHLVRRVDDVEGNFLPRVSLDNWEDLSRKLEDFIGG